MELTWLIGVFIAAFVYLKRIFLYYPANHLFNDLKFVLQFLFTFLIFFIWHKEMLTDRTKLYIYVKYRIFSV